MKIFNVSLHRCGTRSFHQFCLDNGLRPQHWPGDAFDAACEPAVQRRDLDAIWSLYSPFARQHDACSDIPCPVVFRQACTDFPDAKYMLVLRTPSKWIASVRRHTANRMLRNLERLMYASICDREVGRLDQYSDTELEAGYLTHIREVVNFFATTPASFRVFQLEDPFVGPRLASFLGMDHPADLAWVH